DPVRAVLVEGPGDGQRLGAAADALAAHVVADQRPQLGGGLAEEPVEGGEADRLLVTLDDDRELAVLARLAGRPARPAFSLLEREAVALLHQRLGRLGVVEPAVHGRRVARLERAQTDLRPIAHDRNPTPLADGPICPDI